MTLPSWTTPREIEGDSQIFITSSVWSMAFSRRKMIWSVSVMIDDDVFAVEFGTWDLGVGNASASMQSKKGEIRQKHFFLNKAPLLIQGISVMQQDSMP